MAGARRLQRVSQHRSVTGTETVLFYTGVSFTGAALKLTTDDDVVDLGATYDNQIRSIKFIKPQKLYLYENKYYDGAILFLDGKSNVADLSTRYYESNKPFSAAISSIQVRSASYVAPLVPNQPTLVMADNFVVPIFASSNRYSNTSIEELSFDIQNQETYDGFMKMFGPIGTAQEKTATELKILAVINQLVRNICAVIYRDPDQQPARYPITALHFVDTAENAYAWATVETSDIFINKLALSQFPAFMILVLSHELTHTYQNCKYSNTDAKLRGMVEGIATFVSMEHGFTTPRPANGGDNWYAGYATTAYFLDYIMKSSPQPEPDFVHKVVMSMNGADPAIGNSNWSDTVIASLNSRGMSVDQLWQEYVNWVAIQ